MTKVTQLKQLNKIKLELSMNTLLFMTEEAILLNEDKKVKPKIVKIKEFVFSFYEFRINGYTLDLEFKPILSEDEDWKVLDDFCFNDLVYYLKEAGFGNKVNDDLKTILFSSQVKRHYPFKEYFESLGPAHDMGAINNLCEALVLKDPERQINITEGASSLTLTYNEAKSRLLVKWLIACVHSSLGIKPNDVMLILIGSQGKFKSTFLNYLAPPGLSDYLFTGHIVPSITDNNTANFLAEKFIINIDDQMETIFGKEFNAMKAIISADSVTNRKVYKKFAPKRKRLANFVGSVNNSQFLTDSENRRYLCLEVVSIDPAFKQIDINRVWAEAYQLAKKTSAFSNITREDRLLINAISSQFIAPTVELEYLNILFSNTTDNGKGIKLYMKSSEILRAIQVASGNRNANAFRLNTALRRENYILITKRLERLGGLPYKVYVLEPKPHTIDKLLTMGIDLKEYM